MTYVRGGKTVIYSLEEVVSSPHTAARQISARVPSRRTPKGAVGVVLAGVDANCPPLSSRACGYLAACYTYLPIL